MHVAAAAAAGARRSFTLRCGEVWIRRERKHQVGTSHRSLIFKRRERIYMLISCSEENHARRKKRRKKEGRRMGEIIMKAARGEIKDATEKDSRGKKEGCKRNKCKEKSSTVMYLYNS